MILMTNSIIITHPNAIVVLIEGMRTQNEKHAPDKMMRVYPSKFGSRRKVKVRSGQWERTAQQRGLVKIMTQAKLTTEQRVDLWRGGIDVQITRISTHRLHDASESLRSALAAVRDGVADALGVDDRDAEEGGSVRWSYAQEKGPYAVLIQIGPRGTFSPIERMLVPQKPGFCRLPVEELEACS